MTYKDHKGTDGDKCPDDAHLGIVGDLLLRGGRQTAKGLKVSQGRVLTDARSIVEDGRHDGQAQRSAKGVGDCHEGNDGRDFLGEVADAMERDWTEDQSHCYRSEGV